MLKSGPPFPRSAHDAPDDHHRPDLGRRRRGRGPGSAGPPLRVGLAFLRPRPTSRPPTTSSATFDGVPFADRAILLALLRARPRPSAGSTATTSSLELSIATGTRDLREDALVAFTCSTRNSALSREEAGEGPRRGRLRRPLPRAGLPPPQELLDIHQLVAEPGSTSPDLDGDPCVPSLPGVGPDDRRFPAGRGAGPGLIRPKSSSPGSGNLSADRSVAA